MSRNEHTIVEDVKNRLERLTKREKDVDAEIVRVQKRIDQLPKLQARLEQLKEKKKELADKKQSELKDIAELTQFLPVEG